MNTLVLFILAIASISFTISVTSIFAPVREWISKFHPKLEELIHCPYCLSHYITALFFLLDNGLRTSGIWLIFVMYFAVIGGVGLIHFVLLRAYRPIAENMLHRRLEKMRQDKEK